MHKDSVMRPRKLLLVSVDERILPSFCYCFLKIGFISFSVRRSRVKIQNYHSEVVVLHLIFLWVARFFSVWELT